MHYAFTSGLLDAFPDFDCTFVEVKRIAVELDKGIRTKELRVEARRHQVPDYCAGWAWPMTRSYYQYRRYEHLHGLIRLHIGVKTTYEDVVRLCAHELRHIGQFHRGRKRYGHLTIKPLTEAQSEQDAEEFEDRVVERYL